MRNGRNIASKTNSPVNWVFRSASVKTNTANKFWHELGHVIHQGNTQDQVLNFDNLTRSIMKKRMLNTAFRINPKSFHPFFRYTSSPLKNRLPDKTHNKTVH